MSINSYHYNEHQLIYGIKTLSQSERKTLYHGLKNGTPKDAILKKISNAKPENYKRSHLIVRIVKRILNMFHLRIGSKNLSISFK